MSWGHAELELDEDADERAVKRAYAKRLRTTRPDEDPAGFQQLHEAYQAALAWIRSDDEGADAVSDSIISDGFGPGREVTAPEQRVPEASRSSAPRFVHVPVQPAPQPPPVPMGAPQALTQARVVDADRFSQRVVSAALQLEPPGLERWLGLQPELWWLQDKPRLGAAVLEFLLRRNVPMRAQNFDLLSACFSWDDFASGVDPHVYRDCRLRLHRHWVAQPRHTAGLAAFLHRPDTVVSPSQARSREQRLTRPWNRLRTLLSASVPGRTEAMRQTLAMIEVDDASVLPANLQPQQVAFWRALAQRREVNSARLQLAVMRTVLCILAWWAFMGFLATMEGPELKPGRGSLRITDLGIYGTSLILLPGLLLPQVAALVNAARARLGYIS